MTLIAYVIDDFILLLKAKLLRNYLRNLQKLSLSTMKK